MPSSSDRNLLFGILALQMDFITREQLVAGMQAWVVAKDVPLAEHLVRAGALKPANRQLLEPLVEAHIRQHNNDPQQSLESISSIEAIRNELATLKDQEIDVSLAQIPKGRLTSSIVDPYATISVGDASSRGMRFRILRPHAEGGLGRVSIALDGELSREVALKEIKPERADDFDSRGRFTREAEITGGLEHPGIVPVYGLGAYPDGRPFYAMRFIRGKSLKEAIERFHERFSTGKGVQPQSARRNHSATEENLELRKLLQRLIDVCEAMDYAHSRGILHRDLKPGNIMLGKYGETLVVDWGLAKPLGQTSNLPIEQKPTETTVGPSTLSEAILTPSTSGSEPTQLGITLGTPAFMSPEQAQGRLDLLGPTSDVFSLGAILYQILTGKPPYAGPTNEEVLRKAQAAEFPLPRSIYPNCSAPLEAICLRALAPSSANRYPNCRAFATDLERFLADEPVTAKRDSFSERLSRLSRRHRTAFLASAIALVILALGSLIAMGVVNHFRQEANETAENNQKLAVELQGKNVEIKLMGERRKKLADDLIAANGYVRSAVTLNAKRKYAEAEPFYQKALDLNREVFGAKHPGTVTCLNDLAYNSYAQGKYTEAQPLLQSALDVRRELFGDEHPDTATSYDNLADNLNAQKKYVEAQPLYQKALDVRRKLLGEGHVDTINSIKNLAANEYELGNTQLRILSLDIQHFSNLNQGSVPRGSMGRHSFSPLLGDRVTISALLSRPAYAYLIAFRPDGVMDVCFPEDDTQPPPQSDNPRYPLVDGTKAYGLQEGSGLWLFALIATEKPLPAFREWAAQQKDVPWHRVDAPPDMVFLDDGNGLETTTPQNVRGTGVGGLQRKTLKDVMDWLKEATGANAIRVIGFGVQDKK